MKLNQMSLIDGTWCDMVASIDLDPSIFFLFISITFESKQELINFLKQKYPKATIIGCSTAGEISDINVNDNSVSLTAVELDKTIHKLQAVKVNDMEQSFEAGVQLANKFNLDNLKHILVFSDGLNLNGADLVEGLRGVLPRTSITGGLAGDLGDFSETFVVANQTIMKKAIVAIGFYGEQLQVGYSSKGGWDSFGVDRLVTRSNKNILYELDGQPALELYKLFLGANAKNLPRSGLLFPLSIRSKDNNGPIVRTILSINEEDQSLTFAGNIPEGSYVRLMKANIDRLIDGARDSAKDAFKTSKKNTQLALLISCVGRRFVLKQLIEEEVEAVQDILGGETKITGFYSFGEIGPFAKLSPCEFHNQTMTITTLSEC